MQGSYENVQVFKVARRLVGAGETEINKDFLFHRKCKYYVCDLTI